MVASLLGKALILFPGSEVVDLKPTLLIKTYLPSQSPIKNIRAT
jgi:hypothetical protein